MNDPSHLGSSDLEEDYPCIVGPAQNISSIYTPQHQLCTGREGYGLQSRIINTNNGTGSREDIAPQPQPYEGYKLEHKRLETFNDWPSNAPVNKTDLARNGFIYLHINDRVQCVFCRGILSSWEQGDVIEDEHRKHCPECPFAFGYPCGNVPLNQTRTEEPNIQRLPNTQNLPNRLSYPQTRESGNFVGIPGQHGPQLHVITQSSNSLNPSSQNSGGSAVKITSIRQQTPQSNRGIAVQVRPESNADISYNPRSGSLNIYSGNVTLTSGNQDDSVGSLPSLPVSSKPSNQVANVESMIASPKYPKWESEVIRLKSFAGWPAQMLQKPRDLAKAGLLYMGSGDRVKCYWCGGELHDWEPQDDPMEEHAKWFTNCGFVMKKMGDDYIQKIKDKQNGLLEEDPEEPDIYSHPHVLAVLQHGYTRQQIQSAFDRYGKEKLFNATSLMAAIEANRGQKPVTQSGQSTEEKISPLVNPNTEVKDPSPVWQPCSQSEGTEQNNNSSSADIMPPWLEAKRRALFSPQDVIVIQDDSDVEMEDQENKSDPPITRAKDSGEKSEENQSDEETTGNHSKDLSGSSEAATNKLGPVVTMKNKKEIDPVQLENEKLKDQKLCKICMDRELSITFLPCAHLASCEECSKSLFECPICRMPIQDTVKVFWS